MGGEQRAGATGGWQHRPSPDYPEGDPDSTDLVICSDCACGAWPSVPWENPQPPVARPAFPFTFFLEEDHDFFVFMR